jgi:hypothetical protein
MKKIFYFIVALATFTTTAQVGIGVPTANIDASAQLEVASTSKGFLAPRMSETQKNAISSPASGLLVYQIDGTAGFYYYDGLAWKSGLATDAAVTNGLAAEVSNRTNADHALQTNINTLDSSVTANATIAANATALKEDSANKSADVTLANATNVKFPTALAVKTYVDNQVASGTATNVSGIVALANGGTGSATQNFIDLTSNQTVAGIKTFTARIFGKTAFLNGGDGTFGNAFLVNNNDSGFLASYNSLGTIRTGYLAFSSGNSVTLKAEETNSLILGAGNQNTLTLGADQKASFAGGASINGQTDINGSLSATSGTFSQRISGKTAFLNGDDETFGNAFLVNNNDSGFLASYNSLGTIRTGYLAFSSGNSVTLKAEENNSLILGAGNQNTLTLGADQNASFAGNITGASFIKAGGSSSQYLMADGSVIDASVQASIIATLQEEIALLKTQVAALLASNDNEPPAVSIAIGDNYQGGKVAYILQAGDPGYDANVQHGLIIAAASIGGKEINWFPTSEDFGTGLANTNAIANADPNFNGAAQLVRAYNGGGYTDWYLPSLNEARKIMPNYYSILNIAETEVVFNTSSMIEECDYWCQEGFESPRQQRAIMHNPIYGSTDYQNLYNEFDVLPVRSF